MKRKGDRVCQNTGGGETVRRKKVDWLTSRLWDGLAYVGREMFNVVTTSLDSASSASSAGNSIPPTIRV